MESMDLNWARLVMDHVPDVIVTQQWEVFLIVIPLAAGVGGALIAFRLGRDWLVGFVIAGLLPLLVTWLYLIWIG
ncbi:MAG: hypothetical protein OXH13_06690 [Chloroflexi bacterium]|nr:hypothetical protein [Chloroflexota bacterium]MCY3696501.1 hypothetical protein [Chloroflexota bacterium]